MPLKELLKERHITQAELGRRINRTDRMVRNYVSGRARIPLDVARNISWATRIPLAVILDDGSE